MNLELFIIFSELISLPIILILYLFIYLYVFIKSLVATFILSEYINKKQVLNLLPIF